MFNIVYFGSTNGRHACLLCNKLHQKWGGDLGQPCKFIHPANEVNLTNL